MDELLLIWYSGKEKKQIMLSQVANIIPGQRTVEIGVLPVDDPPGAEGGDLLGDCGSARCLAGGADGQCGDQRWCRPKGCLVMGSVGLFGAVCGCPVHDQAAGDDVRAKLGLYLRVTYIGHIIFCRIPIYHVRPVPPHESPRRFNPEEVVEVVDGESRCTATIQYVWEGRSYEVLLVGGLMRGKTFECDATDIRMRRDWRPELGEAWDPSLPG
ncbi:hypothetical protein Dimus_014931 [Dionaea muscipula]